MNVFSNSCAGGFVHAILSNEPYKHPFYWCTIDESEFVDWMLDFDNIDINDKIEVDYSNTKISKIQKHIGGQNLKQKRSIIQHLLYI